MEKEKKHVNYGIIFLVILLILTIIKIMYNGNSDIKNTKPVYKNGFRKEM